MRASLWALALAASIGCSSSTPTRTVTGQLRATSSTAVVTAQSMDHQEYQSSVSSTGRFTLELPTGRSYALDVGRAQLDWPTATGPARWARLGSGATLDLGHVSRTSDGHYACDHRGSEDDHCDRDDGDGGDDDDHGDDDGDYGGGHHGCDGGASSGGGGAGGGGATGGGGIP